MYVLLYSLTLYVYNLKKKKEVMYFGGDVQCVNSKIKKEVDMHSLQLVFI